MSPEPLRVLETPQTERIRDLVTRVRNLDEGQLRIVMWLLAGRDPDMVESTLRVLPRDCPWCGQIIPWPADTRRPL